MGKTRALKLSPGVRYHLVKLISEHLEEFKFESIQRMGEILAVGLQNVGHTLASSAIVGFFVRFQRMLYDGKIEKQLIKPGTREPLRKIFLAWDSRWNVDKLFKEKTSCKREERRAEKRAGASSATDNTRAVNPVEREDKRCYYLKDLDSQSEMEDMPSCSLDVTYTIDSGRIPLVPSYDCEGNYWCMPPQ